MDKALVIVESPAKAATLGRYLGKGHEILASYGHVRDLVPKNDAVLPEEDFRMQYQPIERNARHVQRICRAMAKADVLYLATDPDREGEAIAWHLCELIKEQVNLRDKRVCRVVFHEITRAAILEAFERPGELSHSLIDAQQARRGLDYLVGFNLSPLLWKKIGAGLSAGRVQSPALRMIVEREEEIERFQSREYWTIEADASHADRVFPCRLTRYGGKKLTQFSIADGESAREMRSRLQKDAGGELVVAEVRKKERKRNPAPPFITSTLQQEAARRLGFSAQNTMRVAQRLYEGMDVGDGVRSGLITYMRTDSVHLSAEALRGIRSLIADRYGKESLPAQPRRYKTSAKNAQEAHEAIRPTDIKRLPDGKLQALLDRDQWRLYELIWKRTVASQMASALIDTVAVDLGCKGDHLFRANGATVRKPGFLTVYEEGKDDPAREDEKERTLPPLRQGDRVALRELRADQHFTTPPPRYSEASLVRALEEHGIGRPSTYASIVSTLRQRKYVEMEKKRFVPTDIGRVVSRFLTRHFEKYVDYDFTAHLENDLDAISRGEKGWRPVMKRFWGSFKKQVEEKDRTVSRIEASGRELGQDPQSGRPILARMGRYGPYVQMGSGGDKEKPRFASLMPEQRLDSITLEQALELFERKGRAGGGEASGRELGQDPRSGRPILARMGRYGPYVQMGSRGDKEKPRFASLMPDQRLDSITLEQALELFLLPRTLGEADGNEIVAARGRYGPYVRYGKKYASIKPPDDPRTITLERALELVRAREREREESAEKIKEFPKKGIWISKNRFGFYVTDGKNNAKVPKDKEPRDLSLRESLALLQQASVAKAPAARRTSAAVARRRPKRRKRA